jgi:eukaryotic-like serine/threonine-protein kinase
MDVVTEPGRLLSGRYRLVSLIGRGGMGVVWRVRDEVLKRDVAVKEIIWPPHFTEPEQRMACSRATREAQMAGRLSHVNVVRIYDILEEDGHPWIVMELLPYQSLRDLVAEQGPLPPARAAQVGLGVLAALRAAHAAGILHRDVKPANIMVGSDGRVVLTDFGIARAADMPTLTTAGALVGSPSYMAPERATGGPSGASGDLWGLGASLYAAVEGHPPFERSTPLATLTAVVADEPERALHAGALWPVISGLLGKDPDERLGAAEAEQMLRRIAGNGDTGQVAREQAVRRRWGRRGRRAVPAERAASPGAAAADAAESHRLAPLESPVAPEPESPALPTPVPEAPVPEAPADPEPGEPEALAGPAPEVPGEPEALAGPVSEVPGEPEPSAVPELEVSGPEKTGATRGQPPTVPAPKAALPPDQVPSGSRVTSPPPRRASSGSRRRRGPAVALAALVLAAAAVTAVALSLTSAPGPQAGSPGRSRAATARPTASAGTRVPATAPATSATPRVSASTTASPVSSPAAGGTGGSPGYGALPAGFYRFANSTGFSIGVPNGWQISHVGHYVYVTDPSDGNIFLLIDQSDQPQPNALADWEQQAANRASGYPGYHLIRLQSVSYPQAEQAADWEFTYVRSGVLVHILNRNVLANASHAYALYWSTPESDWTADYRYFQAFAATFRPAPA